MNIQDSGSGICNHECLGCSFAYVHFAKIVGSGVDREDRVFGGGAFSDGNVIYKEVVVAIAVRGFTIEGEEFDSRNAWKRKIYVDSGVGNSL
jgi:hypothetical protein